MESIQVGDTVIAVKRGGKGKVTKVRAKVRQVKGLKAEIEYMQDSSRGRSINWSLKRGWRPLAELEKVAPLPEDEADPSSMIGVLARGLFRGE